MQGRVWRFGDDINTDLMLPSTVLLADPAEQARHVFSANRPGWVDQVAPGDVIVAGRNFGMGSSRPAARSLRNVSVALLLAETINGLFFRMSVNYGFLALECPGVADAFTEGDTAVFDPAAWTVHNPRTGVTMTPLRIPDQMLDLMRNGGIYPVLEARGLIGPDVKLAL